jgi:tRNA(fMet)-specific endonuclease VapC
MNLRVLDTDHISLILRGDRRIIDRLQSLDKSKWAVTIIEKDVKIAAIALANQATIVTRNQRDFMLVPGLALENWTFGKLE